MQDKPVPPVPIALLGGFLKLFNHLEALGVRNSPVHNYILSRVPSPVGASGRLVGQALAAVGN